MCVCIADAFKKIACIMANITQQWELIDEETAKRLVDSEHRAVEVPPRFAFSGRVEGATLKAVAPRKTLAAC